MSLQKIGKYIEEFTKKNKNNAPYPVYSVTNSNGFCTDYFSKDVSGQNKTTYKIVPNGYFAYNPSRINVGSIDWQNSEDNVIVSPLYVVFKCSDSLDQDYLKYFLKSSVGVRLINEKTSGSVRNSLKFKELSEFELNIVDVEEQRRIVNKLKLIESAIENEKKQINLYDELVKARFVEMFGDLADPACKWEKCKLIDACVNSDDIKCGPFGTQLGKDEYTMEGVAVWEIPQINSEFKTLPTHFVTQKKAEELDSYSIIPGDIAMSRKGNVGRCAVFPLAFENGIIHSDVLRIRLDKTKVLPEFMMRQLHYSGDIQHQIEMVSSGAIMAGINVTKLKHISVYLPPIGLQDKFVSFVSQIDKSKFVAKKRLKLYEELLEKKTYDFYIR